MKITRSQLRNLITTINGIPLDDLVDMYETHNVLEGLKQLESISVRLIEANEPFEKAIQALQKTISEKRGLDGQPISQEAVVMLEQQSDAHRMKDESFEVSITEDEKSLLESLVRLYGASVIKSRSVFIELLEALS